MKNKFLYIYSLWIALIFVSCSSHEDEVFDKSASQRIAEAVNIDNEVLESATNGWELHYYTGKDYSRNGYTFLVKFKNGKAIVAADFAGSDSTSTSKYELKRDRGVILTFNTFNEIMHEMAQAFPSNVDGEQGDYEFLILKATRDSVLLKGKKWDNHMTMTRLPDNVNWKERLDSIINIEENIPSLFTIKGRNNETLGRMILDGSTRQLTGTIGDAQTPFSTIVSFSNNKMVLAQNIKIDGKEYSSFNFNNNISTLTNGDIKLEGEFPENFKPMSFWEGLWRINNTSGNILLELVKTRGRLVGTLIFNNTRIPLLGIYDRIYGRLDIRLQQQASATSETYPGGTILLPVNFTTSRFLWDQGNGIYFTWDEANNRANPFGHNENGKELANSFAVLAVNSSGTDIVVDSSKSPVYVTRVFNITSLTRVSQ